VVAVTQVCQMACPSSRSTHEASLSAKATELAFAARLGTTTSSQLSVHVKMIAEKKTFDAQAEKQRGHQLGGI
jgi:hypothetical protein